MCEIYNIMLDISHTDENTRSRKQDYLRLGLYIIVLIIVVISFIGYGMVVLAQGNLVFGIAIIIIAFVIVGAGGIYARIWHVNILKRHVVMDELSERQLYKASFYTFIASNYIMVLMIILLDHIESHRIVVYIGLTLNIMIFLLMNYIVGKQDI